MDKVGATIQSQAEAANEKIHIENAKILALLEELKAK